MIYKTVEIKEPLKTKREEGYYITINYYYNSGGNVNKTYGPFYRGEEESLLRFVNILEKALEAYPNGRGGFDNYEDKVPELKEWYYSSDENKKYKCKDCKKKCDKCKVPEVRLKFNWEIEPNGYYTQADIMYYNVRFFNSLDNKFYNVELK